MNHKIERIETYIKEREQCVNFFIEGQDDPINAKFKVISKLAGPLSIFELELLIGTFCEPLSYYKKGEVMRNWKNASDDNNFPKTWKLNSPDINKLRTTNQSKLLNFQSIYDIHPYKQKNNQIGIRIRTSDNNIYFAQLHAFEEIVGLNQNEFNLLRGTFISPVMYKKGDFSDYNARYIKIIMDDKIVETFNFRIVGTIDNNFTLYGNQELKNTSKDSDTSVENNFSETHLGYTPSFSKYNGYNDFDDDTIDTAFESDPKAT